MVRPRIGKQDLVLVNMANKTTVAANNTAVVSTLLDGTIGAGGSSGNSLPDDLALVAETELGGAVTNDGTVGSASAITTSRRSSGRCSRSCAGTGSGS